MRTSDEYATPRWVVKKIKFCNECGTFEDEEDI